MLSECPYKEKASRQMSRTIHVVRHWSYMEKLKLYPVKYYAVLRVNIMEP